MRLFSSGTYSRPRYSKRRLLLVLWCFLLSCLLLGGPALAYTVILKDGKSIQAQHEPTVRGDKLEVVLSSGTRSTIPLSEVDLAKTEAYNRRSYGTAQVLQGNDRTAPFELGTAAPPSLQQYLERRKANEAPANTGSAGRGAAVRKTKGGYDDLTAFDRRPYRGRGAEELDGALRNAGLVEFSLNEGTKPERILLELRTDDAKSVFNALEVSARTFQQLAGANGIRAFELIMVTSNKSRAGQFVLTAENVGLLVDGQVTPAEFFYDHVQF